MIRNYSFLSKLTKNKTKIKIIIINNPMNNLINSPIIPLWVILIPILTKNMISPRKFNNIISKFILKME
jgi:hypothetical protein